MNHLLLIEHAAHFEVARAYAMMFLAAGWKVTLAINEKNHGFWRMLWMAKPCSAAGVEGKGG